VESVKINAVLRDGAGNIVDGGYTYSDIDTLTPGMISSFGIIFSDTPAYTTIELTVTWAKTDRRPYELQITNLETYFDSSDSFHAKGIVTNQTGGARTFVKVFIVLYDANNQVIGADSSYLNPYDLSPGQQIPFDEYVYFWKGKPNRSLVHHYSVRAFDD